jgi:septum site-determining protein MinD
MASPRIIAVGSARDGVGKTVFAVNAALALLKETRKRVLVLDLDQESCGDVQKLLGMKKAKSMADFAPYADKLKPAQLRQYISAHPVGLGVIPLLPGPHEGGDLPITPDQLSQLISLLDPLCDYIFVDCGVGVNPHTVKVLEKATALFTLCTPDPLVLEHTSRFIDRLQSLHFPKEMIQVILNRQAKNPIVTKEMVQKKLQRQVLVVLQDDENLCKASVLNSKPFVVDQPRAALSRDYDEFMRQLVEKKILEQLGQVARPKELGGAGGGRAGIQIAGVDVSKELKTYQKSRGKKTRNTREIDERTAVKMIIHKRMVETIDLKRLNTDDDGPEAEAALRDRVKKAVIRILDEVGKGIKDRKERQRIVKEVVDEALGLGPLEDFLADDQITEIMVNRVDQIYVERNGKLVETDASFTDDAQLLAVIERIVAPIGRRIDEKSPMVDARLSDGSRVNAIIPPLALDGPSLTIRKFSREPLQVKDLVAFGSMTAEIADFLRACVEARLNVLISGGTGSGKTTLLNVLSSFIPSDDRIITIEDSAELQLNQPHVVRLESRPANIEGVGEISIRDLVKNCLRMRPDRIVIGEVRGSEALDMLQAMNTGHDGSLTTIHSNSARDCIARLETLVMFAGLDLPSRAIREQVASAVDLIVQQSRLSDGSRRIMQIAELTGMEGPTITLQDIFVFRQTGVGEDGKVQGRFVSTGFVPRFVHELEAKGIRLPKGIFAQANPQAPRGR